jgi:NAD(P)H-hydrate repair Nnr-like enzyme with NAD(P)H-hydrate dehydratase domain
VKCTNDIALLALQDGVFLLSKEPNLISGNTKAVLTPNVIEFARLYAAVV